MVYKSYRGFDLNPIWVLILINFLLFIATTINQDIVFLLGLSRLTFFDKPWTIVTSLFVHGSFLHILFNMITLYFFGTYLIRLVGDNKFLIVYFGGGILGSVFYILLGPLYIPAIGASGAIFALGGALAVLRPKVPVRVFPIPAPIPLWTAVIGGFIILTILTRIPPFLNIAWQVHLGGLIFGLVAGYFFRRRARYYSF